MLNIKINKLLKMEDSFNPGNRGGERRSLLELGQRLWRGELGSADVNLIKEIQNKILTLVQESQAANLSQAEITNLEVKKLALIKQRNQEAKKLTEEERVKLGNEIMADFSVIN